MSVTFEEYQKAKLEIIRGVKYKEHSNLEPDGRISKQYLTEGNGGFYEITYKGITEFWSDRYSISRYYDGRTREELLADWKDLKNLYANSNAEVNRLASETVVLEAKNKELEEENKALKEKLAAINSLIREVAA